MKAYISIKNNMFGVEIRDENNEFQRARICSSIKDAHKYCYEHGITYENLILTNTSNQ